MKWYFREYCANNLRTPMCSGVMDPRKVLTCGSLFHPLTFSSIAAITSTGPSYVEFALTATNVDDHI
jgi:hypothetical protein